MDTIFLILCILCIVFFLTIIPLLRRQYAIWSKVRDLPQDSYPFIGNTYTLIKKTNVERKEWLLSLINKHKEGIVLNWIIGVPIVIVFNPNFCRTIMNNSSCITKGIMYTCVKNVLKEGLLTSAGTQWHHDRNLFKPTFHRSTLNEYAVIISKKTEIFITCLEEKLQKNLKKPIDIYYCIMRASFDIISCDAMELDLSPEGNESDYASIIHRVIDIILFRMVQPWYWIDWIFYLTPLGRKYKSLIKRGTKFQNEIIHKKRIIRKSQNMQLNENNNDENKLNNTETPKKGQKVLDILLEESEKSDNPMTDAELHAHVYTFMTASHDTTATAISWALFLLGNNLEQQEKVHEELETIFPNPATVATTDKLSELKYLDRVIKETLRLWPIIPVIAKRLSEEVNLGDYTLPKNAEIVFPIILMHLNPEYWPNPTKFDPDRFLPENSVNRHPFAYIPFSAGPRNCLGQKFAQIVMKTVLTAILRKWRVKSVETLDTIRTSVSIVYRPDEKVLLYFIPKKLTS